MSLRMIEKKVWVYGGWGGKGGGGGGADALKFSCGRSRTRLKNSSETWNLDLAENWISIASNKMLIEI